MLNLAMNNMEKQILQRCGSCGSWQSDPSGYTDDEVADPELIHCGCEEDTGPKYVTHDMAVDAGDLSLEGQII